MIDRMHTLPVTRQCQLLSLNRSTVYYQPKPASDEDLELMRRIDEMHLQRPFYGSRRIRDWLWDLSPFLVAFQIRIENRPVSVADALHKNSFIPIQDALQDVMTHKSASRTAGLCRHQPASTEPA